MLAFKEIFIKIGSKYARKKKAKTSESRSSRVKEFCSEIKKNLRSFKKQYSRYKYLGEED